MKKLSEELDEETLAIIIRKQTYQGTGATGSCECCEVAIDGSAYDVLRQPERRCQVCKMLGERKDRFTSGMDG